MYPAICGSDAGPIKNLSSKTQYYNHLRSHIASLCNLHWSCSLLEEHFLVQLSNLRVPRRSIKLPASLPVTWSQGLNEGRRKLKNGKHKVRMDLKAEDLQVSLYNIPSHTGFEDNVTFPSHG